MKKLQVTDLDNISLKDFKFYSGIDACGSGRCPRVLVNNAGDVIIQGLDLTQEVKLKMSIPDGESVVYLPKEILTQLKIKVE